MRWIRHVVLAALLLAVQARPAAADQGLATWYGPGFHGHPMYNGQTFNMYDPTTAASNVYPIGAWLAVTNLSNGREVIVQIRDRGAFRHSLDLSMAAFALLDDLDLGVLRVAIRPSGPPIPVTRPPAPPGSQLYAVQPGETLSSIAARYGTTVEALVAANGLPTPHYLQAGQELVIPPTGNPTAIPYAAAPATGVARADPAAPVAADPYAAASPASSTSPITPGPLSAPPPAPPADPTAPSQPPAEAGLPSTGDLASAGVAGDQAAPVQSSTIANVNGDAVARAQRRGTVVGLVNPPGVDYAYLRQSATTASSLLGAIARGERVELVGVAAGDSVAGGDNRWWYVRYGGAIGYVWYPLVSIE